MRIALAQINNTVGDLEANAAKILDFARRAEQAGAELVEKVLFSNAPQLLSTVLFASRPISPSRSQSIQAPGFLWLRGIYTGRRLQLYLA